MKVIQNNQVDFIVDEEEEVDCKLKVDTDGQQPEQPKAMADVGKEQDADNMSEMNMDMFDWYIGYCINSYQCDVVRICKMKLKKERYLA